MTCFDLIEQCAENDDELRVGRLLCGFGLTLVRCGKKAEIKDDHGGVVGQLDFVFKDSEERRIFFVEVSKRREAERSQKINHFFSKWSSPRNLTLVKKQLTLPNYRIVRTYVDTNAKSSSRINPSVKHNLDDADNRIVFLDDLEYFEHQFKIIDKWAKNDLYHYLEIEPKPLFAQKDAIQFYLGETVAYVFADTVKDLLRYAYVARRRGSDAGYQRMLKEGRAGTMAKAIRRRDIIAFPNSILLNCPTPITDKPLSAEKCPGRVKVNIPDSFCSCRIVDGQHRLLSFAKLGDLRQENYSLPVVILQNLNRAEEIGTFIDINAKQVRIDPNLILLLKADTTWNKKVNPKEFFEKIAVEVVKRLNSQSSISGRIYFGRADEPKGDKITLATLVSVILKNNLVGQKTGLFQQRPEDVKGPYQGIKDLFSTVNKHLPPKADGVNAFLYSNKGLRVLFRFVQLVRRNIDDGNVSFDLAKSIEYLSQVLSKNFIAELEDYYGEGGARRATEGIISAIKDKHATVFEDFSTDLKELS